MPEENQRITREHLPGLLLARTIWERGPSLYFPPALKTATDQARACSLEMKTHCVELYRDAPELHEVVLASEALAACAARDARIVELESGQSADMFLTLTGEITQLRAELAAIEAQEPVAHDTKGGRKALGAMNAKLKAKIGRLERELAAPAAKPQVVIPELDREGFEDEYSGEYGTPVSVLRLLRDGENYIEKPQHSDRLNSSWWMWKRALARLNAAPVQQVSVPDGWKLVPVEPTPKMIDATWYHEIDMSCGIESQGARNKRIYEAMLIAAPAAPGAKP